MKLPPPPIHSLINALVHRPGHAGAVQDFAIRVAQTQGQLLLAKFTHALHRLLSHRIQHPGTRWNERHGPRKRKRGFRTKDRPSGPAAVANIRSLAGKDSPDVVASVASENEVRVELR